MADPILLVKSDERRYTLGVVYEPDAVDTDGEFAKASTIEQAAWDFMSKRQRAAAIGVQMVKAMTDPDTQLGEQSFDVTELIASGLDDAHKQVTSEVGTVVESYIAPTDFQLGEQTVKKGAWLMGVVWTPDMFDKIKSGDRTGLSMFGRAKK